MRRRLETVLVAKVGAGVFAVALGLPLMVPPSGGHASAVLVATVVETSVAASLAGLGPLPMDRPVAVTSVVEAAIAAGAASTEAAPAPPQPPDPLVTDGPVLASWYGPGFFGNRTACGQTLTAETPGVAHPTLPCGTLVRITSPAGVTVVAPVIDRGPFVAGRQLDLSNATKVALACGDLCRVHMTVVQ